MTNVRVISGNANGLTNLVGKVESPVILSLQNSLGTWIGDWRKAVGGMCKIAEEGLGEVVISVLCQEGLEKYGVDMYMSVSELVGEPDLEATDLEAGVFRSKTGYRSQWWTREQREKIKEILGGKVIEEVEYPTFNIFHIKY